MKHDLLLWLAGFSRELAAASELSPLDEARMRKVGPGVLLSGATAMFSGWKAAEWMTVGQPDMTRTVASFVTGAALATLIVYLDRVIIVATDQRSPRSRVLWLRAVRVAMIVSFALATTLKLLPSIISPDLVRWSLDDRDQRDDARAQSLASRYGLDAKRRREQADQDRLEVASRNLATIPADIMRDLKRSEQCFAQVSKRRRALEASGVTTRSAAAEIRGQRQACAAALRRTNDRLAAYRVSARAEFNNQLRVANQSKSDARDASSAVDEGVREGRAIDKVAVTPASLSVLATHVFRNPFVLMQVMGVFVIIMLFDASGLLSKTALGRTDAGRRIGNARATVERDEQMAFEQAEFEAREWQYARQSQSAALASALHNPDTQAAFRNAFIRLAEVVAPLGASATVAQEIQRHAAGIERTIRVTPSAGSLLAELLAHALADGTRNLREVRQ